jgi:hypothetical protein
MPIPTAFDHRMAEIDNMVAGVVVSLRTLQWSQKSDGRQLREKLQEFVDAVTELANEIIASR